MKQTMESALDFLNEILDLNVDMSKKTSNSLIRKVINLEFLLTSHLLLHKILLDVNNSVHFFQHNKS